jgi:RNA polymerase sigma-70 factor (ECF subfamily)
VVSETGQDPPTYGMARTTSHSPDDAALVLEVAAGSEDALASLYDRHVDAIYGLAMRLTDDRGLAEEVVQETFLALWNRAELYDPSLGTLTAWLRTIARNRTVDRLRALGRRPKLVPISAAGAEDERDAATLDRLLSRGQIVGGADVGPGPEAAIERLELRAAVNAALATIPESERVVIELAYKDELTQTEIAERLGWPLGTVKTRTRRALQRMRQAMTTGLEHGADLEPVPIGESTTES